MQALLAGLTDEQREAVTTDATPLLVIAGAGSGKTRVLTRRIAWQAANDAIDPRHVLAVTFTRKAASELRSRLHVMGLETDVTAGTFHALALAQLRRHWLDTGRRVPKVLDRKTRLLARLLRGNDRSAVGAVAREIEWAQARRVGPDDYASAAAAHRRTPPLSTSAMSDVYAQYIGEKRRRGVVDFDDLLDHCADLLETDGDVADAVRWRYRHVFVDEFQDVNPAQFRLLRAWLGARTDLCAVGDDDQAIYGFGGADARYLTDFTEHFGADATIVRLTANFRSTPEILALANAVSRPSPADERRLVATIGNPGESPRPTLTAYADERAEAHGIAEAIGRFRSDGTAYGDVAVLARTNAQCSVLEEELTAHGVPVHRRGATRFLDHPDVERTIALIGENIDDGFDTALRAALSDSSVASVLAELGEEYVAVEGEHASAPGFRDFIAASVRDEDPLRARDAVDVLTFHRAKGLEWPVVFVTGLEDGFVPVAHASGEAAQNEERRLLHVAFTRAERRLHLSWARRRRFGESASDRELSPFLTGVAHFLDADEPHEGSGRAETDHGRSMLAGAVTRLREAAPGNGSPDPLFDALRTWRDTRARAAGVPSTAVVDDATLRAISMHRPTEVDELTEVSGLGAARATRYGSEIIDLVADYAER